MTMGGGGYCVYSDRFIFFLEVVLGGDMFW